MADFQKIAEVSELPAGGRKSLVIDDRAALLLRVGEDFYAVEDVCSHDGQPLTDGPLEGTAIECPRHGAEFDVRTGKALCMPATEPIATFEVQVRGNDIFVRSEGDGMTTGTASPAADTTAGNGTNIKAAGKGEPDEAGRSEASSQEQPAGSGGPSDSVGMVQADELTLIEALKQVIDPELMINVVDLGLVYSVQQEDDKVNVEMTLTSPACPAGPQIVSQAKLALERVEGVKEAQIKLVMSPPWSPDRMTDEARDQLGIF